MTTLLDLIERVRLIAGDHPSRDTLAGTYTAAGASLSLTDGSRISVGSELEIDLEIFRVTDKPDTVTATVAFAQKGSTNANHALAAEVLTAYRYSRFQIRNAINNALDSITSAFGKTTWDASQSFSSRRFLDAPAAALRVWSVQGAGDSIGATDRDFDEIPFHYYRTIHAGASATGQAVKLTGYNPGTGVAYIGYDAVWPHLSALTDSLDSAFPADGLDLLEMGAVSYLLDPSTFKRVAFDAPHARLGEAAVPTVEITNAARGYMLRFMQRRTELAVRMREEHSSWIKSGR